MDWDQLGVSPADILLPDEKADHTAFAVVACDQYTSEPEYWERAEKLVGDKPSALHMILPEIDLGDAQKRVPLIHAAMADYLMRGVLTPRVQNGFVLTVRTTQTGVRPGLVVKLDLEKYSYNQGAKSLVRATEGTILSRIPPRMAVRRNAPVELPHVLVLMDDPGQTVIEPVFSQKEDLPLLYDFPLMLGGGHLKGYAVTDEKTLAAIHQSLKRLKDHAGFLFAVGDGNHSLATAKAIWEEIKPTLSKDAQKNHPARFALVELENIHCPALQFEPIHRLVASADTQVLLDSLTEPVPGKDTFTVITEQGEKALSVPGDQQPLPVGTLQAFLDTWLTDHPGAQIDYIHGESALRQLAKKPGAAGFIVPTLDKAALFPAVNEMGALPRKTFSMGEAHEKRFYLEARRIK